MNAHRDDPDFAPSGGFVVVTTGDLPEAWFLVHHLLARGCPAALLNVVRRSKQNQWHVIRRLGRRHGYRYLLGLVAARLLRSRYQRPECIPFPEIDARAIAELRTRIAVHDTSDPHAPDALAFVRARRADWLLVAGAPVLGPELYAIPRHGAINRHLGLSPLYRGSDCPIWSLAAGDVEHFGFTIHRVVERVDGGDRLLQRRVPLVAGEDFSAALARINRAGSEGFVEVIDAILSGQPLPGEDQSGAGRHYPPAPLGVIRRARAEYGRAVAAA